MKLDFDINPVSLGWSAGVGIGLFDANLALYPGTNVPNPHNIFVHPGRSDGGLSMPLYVRGLNGIQHAEHIGWNIFSEGTWYHCIVQYDQGSDTASLTVTERSTGHLVGSAHVTNIGGLPADLDYLGFARDPAGDCCPVQGWCSGYSCSTSATALLDNVSFSNCGGPPGECISDEECDDGNFCNAPERCAAGECVPCATACQGEARFCNETYATCCRCDTCAQDADCDGLSDSWETIGIDGNGDGQADFVLTNADPLHKDLYVEVDAMQGRAPSLNDLNAVVQAFNVVPNDLLANPDGQAGITLHVELDEIAVPIADWQNAWTGFDAVKIAHFGTPGERASANWVLARRAKLLAYRYCVFANRYWNPNMASWNSSGLGELPGNDFMVTLGGWNPVGGTSEQKQGTLMHELGHALNLQHGGGDSVNYKPNYHSVMNYTWQTRQASPNAYRTSWVLDYSRASWGPLDEADLDEATGIGGHAGHSVPIGPPPFILVAENGPVDWNGNGIIDAHSSITPIVRDINWSRASDTSSPRQMITAYNDWFSLRYALGGHPNFADGVHTDTSIDDEMTVEAFEDLNSLLGVFEPPIAQAGGTVHNGATLPIKFHMVDTAGNAVIEAQEVMLRVSGPGPNGADVCYEFTLTDGTLRFDDTEEPPHYIANFSTRNYPVMSGAEYVAIVYLNDIPVGNASFLVTDAPRKGQTHEDRPLKPGR